MSLLRSSHGKLTEACTSVGKQIVHAEERISKPLACDSAALLDSDDDFELPGASHKPARAVLDDSEDDDVAGNMHTERFSTAPQPLSDTDSLQSMPAQDSERRYGACSLLEQRSSDAVELLDQTDSDGAASDDEPGVAPLSMTQGGTAFQLDSRLHGMLYEHQVR